VRAAIPDGPQQGEVELAGVQVGQGQGSHSKDYLPACFPAGEPITSSRFGDDQCILKLKARKSEIVGAIVA